MFVKYAETPVTGVQKLCPQCGQRLIPEDQSLCDICEAQNHSEEVKDVLQDSECSNNKH